MRIIAGYGTCIGSPVPITKGRNSISSALSSSIQPSPALMRGSFTHWQNAVHVKAADRQSEADRAFDAAGGSLLADHRDPGAHWAMGRALWLRGEDAASLRELEEAVALSPNFASGYYAIS